VLLSRGVDVPMGMDYASVFRRKRLIEGFLIEYRIKVKSTQAIACAAFKEFDEFNKANSLLINEIFPVERNIDQSKKALDEHLEHLTDEDGEIRFLTVKASVKDNM